MIFVTLGTQDKSFVRLLKKIEELLQKGVINDEVVVQAGFTKFESNYMKIHKLISFDEFEEYMDKCSLLITHGGVGSIINGIKRNKKVIAVPRLKSFKEHTNDHQIQIVNNFANAGYILKSNCDDLEIKYKSIKKFNPKKFISNNENFVENLRNYINGN